MFRYTNVRLKPFPFVTAIALFCALSAHASANLVVNGDFEAGPHDTTGTISDWIVSGTGNGASASTEGSTSGDFSARSERRRRFRRNRSISKFHDGRRTSLHG